MTRLISTALFLASLAAFALTSSAQEEGATTKPSAKKNLEAKDYGTWESLRGSGTLSPDGRWLAYSIRRTNSENELRLRLLVTDEKHAIAYGKQPQFSKNNRWFGYLTGVSEKESKKLKKSKKPVHNSFTLRDLKDGKETKVEGVSSFSFSEEGNFVALKRYAGKDAKGGSDLLVRNLTTSEEMCFGNVSSLSWCESAPLLALTVNTGDKVGSGVLLYNANTGQLKSLDSHKAKYKSMGWREDAADLLFVRETDHDKKKDEEPTHVVVAWRHLDQVGAKKTVYDHREDKSFPKDMRVVSSQAPSWHQEGKAIFFSIREWENKPEKKDDKEDHTEKDKDVAKTESRPAKEKKDKTDEHEPKKKKKKEKKAVAMRDSLDDHAGVEVWHARDTKIIPSQKKTAARDRTKSWLCALWLDSDKFVQLGNKTVDSMAVFENGDHALGRDTDKYEKEAMFGPNMVDAYLVDTRTGERKKILEHHKMLFGASPNGKFYLYAKNNAWHLYDIMSDKHDKLDVTGKVINDESKHLTDEKRPYGNGGWSKDSKYVYLYTQFDIHRVDLRDRSVVRLTTGKETGTRFRMLGLDRDEDHVIHSKPIYLTAYGEYTKKSGFARLNPDGSVDDLIGHDKRVSSLAKAEDADVYVFNQQGFDDSPDIFVAGLNFKTPRQVTATNPQQKSYHWGHAELVKYTNAHGEELQGALYYPANYEAGKSYPMIVYIYEKRSQNLHSYSAPTETNPYNPAVFTTQGYFFFQPDIVYRAQNPGLSAVNCVVPAVKAILARGMVDKKKVGLMGHSWGAYQTAFIVSRSEVFAAGVAGAPLTNMMSMSTNIYWNSGSTNARIFHESQGRMDKPFWQDIDTYVANSPIFGMDSMTTPLLIAFGDKDGAVDWHQGIEMYNAARLAEKQLVMLVYEGENHSLRKKPNQVDYHWRVREWFDHYLKGTKPASWITKGQSFLDREKEIKKLDKEKKSKKGKKKPEKESSSKPSAKTAKR
ncbi:MAG: dipeptidyl aminopeptidase/acylaminoacyl peptidase [Planctomycetota bacterium]